MKKFSVWGAGSGGACGPRPSHGAFLHGLSCKLAPRLCTWVPVRVQLEIHIRHQDEVMAAAAVADQLDKDVWPLSKSQAKSPEPIVHLFPQTVPIFWPLNRSAQ